MPSSPSNNLSPEFALETLLGRKQTHLDPESIREQIQGRVVMVTGAAGSIGSELSRQIADLNPLALVGFDQAETPLFKLESELRGKFPGLSFHSEIGSIVRPEDVHRVMEQYRPSIVLHAAAFKHVPMLEQHPFAAVENNIFGTWRVAQAALQYGVRHFVLISTDKAVHPASIMGATKRVAELAIGVLEKKNRTQFATVRFGNVLESSGSVVPIFREQLAAGGPLTVTHAEMERHFMTTSEACGLVLQALHLAGGGETFVLDMGRPVSVVDLANRLIQLRHSEQAGEIRIEFTGIRPGEKLREQLYLDQEHPIPTSHPGIMKLISAEQIAPAWFEARLQELEEALTVREAPRMIALLQELVPEYVPSCEVLDVASQAQPMLC